MPSPRVNLTNTTQANSDFQSKYSVPGYPSWAQPLSISWPDFMDAVENNGGFTDLAHIALRFVHRYDDGVWYLTMIVCLLDSDNAIAKTGNSFDLTVSGIAPSKFNDTYDPNYFNNVLFEGSAINHNVYVNNIVFPYLIEIKALLNQNMLPDNDPGVSIVFKPCSFYYDDQSACLVNWPHTIVAYMNGAGHGDYLDDAQYTSFFINRAGDVGTLCPPNCSHYVPVVFSDPGSE